MEAHHTLEIHADARAVQHHRPAEAVADRARRPGAVAGVCGERLVRGPEPGGAGVDVPEHRVHQRARVLGVAGGPAIPVHVGRERHVAQLRQHVRPPRM